MLTLFDYLLLFAGLVYGYHVFQFYRGLARLAIGRNQQLFSVSIIVPMRNEAANIQKCLQSLKQQQYPAELIEVIVVDDQSTDDTVARVQPFLAAAPRWRLISAEIGTDSFRSTKKQALTQAIRVSQNEIICTLDADCEVTPHWLSGLVSYFEPAVGMVAGPVFYPPGKNWFERLQALEFCALVAAGAGSIGSGKPLIVNGANLAYRKSVFLQVHGFEGSEQLISGDDDLFLQKIARETTWIIRFAITPGAQIRTRANATVADFLNQRSRWASKTAFYQDFALKFFLIATYIFYWLLFSGGLLILSQNLTFFVFVTACLLKLIVDFLVLQRGCHLFQQRTGWLDFLLAELLQIPYIIYVPIRGILGQFNWKARPAREQSPVRD
jgi:cellulose synthase/poly-beta-1,6-N-acetylglucosamine synthase-like glycosyltransferase